MSSKDLETLRQVMTRAVGATHERVRVLEDKLGIGHGNLEKLLDGRLELRVRHLLDLARILSVPVADFFELGCPESKRSARTRLADWISPRTPLRDKKGGTPLPSTAEELAELVRAVLRQENAGTGGGERES